MSILIVSPDSFAIPDNSWAGVSDVASVTGATGTLTSIVVSFRYTHTYPGDLRAYLKNPDGTEFEMWVGSGSTAVSNQLVEITISDPATTFGTSTHNGDWTFRVADVSGADTGNINEWQIEFFGINGDPRGQINATLAFEVSISGGSEILGPLVATLGFDAEFVGFTPNQFGAIDANLGFAINVSGFQDWVSLIDPVKVQELYFLTITGAADGVSDIDFKASSWQATNQAGARQSYLQAVIPAAADLIQSISDRQSGELVLYKGYRFSDGTVRKEEILRSKFDTFRYDRGHRSFTVTVSGYLGGKQSQNANRTLKGVRSISLTNGKHRVRSDIDLFLQPGMTVTADNVTFQADYISYYVSGADKFCEVSER